MVLMLCQPWTDEFLTNNCYITDKMSISIRKTMFGGQILCRIEPVQFNFVKDDSSMIDYVWFHNWFKITFISDKNYWSLEHFTNANFKLYDPNKLGSPALIKTFVMQQYNTLGVQTNSFTNRIGLFSSLIFILNAYETAMSLVLLKSIVFIFRSI
jgi:hypothetical protein